MWKRFKIEDSGRLNQYLYENEPETCTILGNIEAAGLKYRPFMMRGGYYYIYVNDGPQVEGVIVLYNDGNVMMHLSSDIAQKNVMRILSTMRFHSIWGLSGWLPNRKILGMNLGMTMDQRSLVMMIRDKEIPLKTDDSHIIRIDNKLQINRYIPFVKQCLFEGFGFKTSTMDLKKRMRERTSKEPYWILYRKSIPMAQAHLQALTNQYGYIGGICTLREYRRQGCAKQVTTFACKYVERHGKTSVLAVSTTNIHAIELYKNLGFYEHSIMKVYMRERSFKGDENE